MTHAAQIAEYGKVIKQQTNSQQPSAPRQVGQPVTQSEIRSAAKRAAGISPSVQQSSSFAGIGQSQKTTYGDTLRVGMMPSVYAQEQPEQIKRDQTYEISQARDYYGTGITKPYGEQSIELTKEQLNVKPRESSWIDKANIYVSKSIKENKQKMARLSPEYKRRSEEGGATPLTPILNKMKDTAVGKWYAKKTKPVAGYISEAKTFVEERPVTAGALAYTSIVGAAYVIPSLNVLGTYARQKAITSLAKIGLKGKAVEWAVKIPTYVAESYATKYIGETAIKTIPSSPQTKKYAGDILTGVRIIQAEVWANVEGSKLAIQAAKTKGFSTLSKPSRAWVWAKTKFMPGALEGTVSTNVLLDRGNIDIGHVRIGGGFLPSKVIEGERNIYSTGRLGASVLGGLFGGVTASSFGYVEGLAMKSKIGSKFVDVLGYSADFPGEIVGDALTPAFTASRKFSYGRVFVPTPTLTSTFESFSKPSATETSYYTPTKTSQPIKTQINIPSISKVPTVANVPVPSAKDIIKSISRSTSTTRVPSTVPSITNVPATVPSTVPATVPSITNVPVLTTVPSLTKYQSYFNVPSMTTIMTPDVFIPPMIPLPSSGGGGKGFKFPSFTKRKTKYQPSLYGLKFKKKAKKDIMDDFLSGIEIRYRL